MFQRRGRRPSRLASLALRVTEMVVVFLAAFGDAPGADHLDVVVHQRARGSRVAQFDQVGELAVDVEDVMRELGRGGDVAARPGDVLERNELHHQDAVMRGLGDGEMEIARQAGEQVEIGQGGFRLREQAAQAWRYRRPWRFPPPTRRPVFRSRAARP